MKKRKAGKIILIAAAAVLVVLLLLLMEAYEKAGGIMSGEEVLSALGKAVQPQGKWTTKWTIGYEDGGKPGLIYYWNAVFDKPMEIEVPPCTLSGIA